MKKLLVALLFITSIAYASNSSPIPKWVVLVDSQGTHIIDDGDYDCTEYINLLSGDHKWYGPGC